MATAVEITSSAETTVATIRVAAVVVATTGGVASSGGNILWVCLVEVEIRAYIDDGMLLDIGLIGAEGGDVSLECGSSLGG